MDATELGRWTRFAAKGGIGRCTALQDCVAEEPEDLMFMKDDEITVLMQLADLKDTYLGYCEGVVGRFSGSSVQFHSRLKRPVMARRSSAHRSASTSSLSKSRPSSSQSTVTLSARDTASPPLPSHSSPAPTSSPRMSYSYSNSSSVATEVSSMTNTESTSSVPDSPVHDAQTSKNEVRMRSMSYSSISTALDSAPLTPADFLHQDEDSHGDVHVVISSGKHTVSHDGHDEVPAVTLPHNDFESLPTPVISPLNIRKHSPVVPSYRSMSPTQPESTPSQDASQESISFDTEDSSRISLAMSDGIVGIGLSLLQDFVGGDNGEDNSSMISDRSVTNTPHFDDETGTHRPDSPASTVEGHPTSIAQSDTRSESQYSMSPQSTQWPLTDLPPPAPPYARDSDSIRSRNSVHPSMSDSEFGGSDWEGASDIYDNYRYSRFSMASKASRFSQGSLRPVGPGSDVPPIPIEKHHSPSASSDIRILSPGGDRLGSPISINSSNSPTSATIGAGSSSTRSRGHEAPSVTALSADVSERIIKGKPSPLELVSGQASSPLLHASFGSPIGPSTPLSMESFISPPSRSPNVESSLPSGASSASSFRAQQEHSMQRSSPIIRPSRESFVQVSSNGRFSGQDIVIEDDEVDSVHPDSALVVSLSSEDPTHHATSSTNELAPPPYTVSPPMRVTSPPVASLGTISPLQQASPSTPIARTVNPHGQPADPSARQSLFLPHPHAPRPAQIPSGPMYGRQPAGFPEEARHPTGPPQGSAIQTLHMALHSNHVRHPTIYARFERDLASSTGPVPISFALEPPVNILANRPGVLRPPASPYGSVPQSLVGHDHMHSDRPRTQSPRLPELAGEAAFVPSATQPLQRPNFVPQAPAQRPRSRSFSGFDMKSSDASLMSPQSHTDGNLRSVSPSMAVVTKRSKSASATPVAAASTVSLPSPQRATVSHSSTAVRTVQKPSPLSFSQNNIVAPPPSPPPLIKSPIKASVGLPMSPPTSSPVPATPAASVTSFDRTSVDNSSQKDTYHAGGSLARQQSHATQGSGGSISSPPSSPRSPYLPMAQTPVLRHSRSSILPAAKAASSDTTRSSVPSQGRSSADQARRSPHVLQSSATLSGPASDVESGSSPMQRTSLRPKMSLSALRVHNEDRPLLHGDRSPASSVFSFEHKQDSRTVSIKDMDFELVRPTIPQSPLVANSVESLPLPNSVTEVASTSLADSSSDSVRLPSLDRSRSTGDRQALQGKDTPDMEAHRNRELRWISAISSIPAAQSRKNKKIRKLVLEGVPASVRYLVWAHLTDSKAKRMDGLYGRLGERESVSAIRNIEQDAQQIFNNQPLQDQSLVNLLQAYLTMVPDIQYNRGLAIVASQLLLQSPEEDAFWTFVSLMDSHLRPYFSINNLQLEVDASLFSRIIEAHDPSMSKKIFVDMAVSPVSICRSWFACVFADSFSSEYLHRIWDVFLFEGVTFLFRVGLAIVSCCRRVLLQCLDQNSLMDTLFHPPVTLLPPSPEAFIEMALSVKLKDDDLRKQRTKMEAQMKRQTSNRLTLISSVGRRGSTPPISLPRN